MKQILAEGGIRLTKSLGQNFLHDANQLRRIVEAAELKRSDKILEIGPGLGPLTELLLRRAGEVMAIEKDAKLVEVLRQRFGDTVGVRPSPGAATSSFAAKSNPGLARYEFNTAGAGDGRTPAAPLHLLHDDALDYLRREERDWSQWKLVANLPYSVASPILVELAQARRGPQRMVATLQIEVARRITARAGDEDYGLLTLLLQLDYEPRSPFKISASCFFPEPDVDSACVCLVRRPQAALDSEQKRSFTRIARRSFSQRRKMMLKLLKEDWSAERVEQAFAQLDLPRHSRAETVSLEQFVRLTQILSADSERE